MPLVLGVGVGLVLGLTGAGGGILAVPALVFGLGWGAATAAPVALLAVAGAALLGAVQGMRARLVRYKAAALMAGAGVPVTALGVRAAHALPERVLLFLFVCAMLVVAVRMVRRKAPAAAPRAVPCRMDPATGRLHWTPVVAAILASIGALSGFLTGLLGVGGGFVIVPSLRQVSDISVHGVVATSLAVIALVAGGSVLVSWWEGAALPLLVAGPFVAGAATGMLAGRRIVHRLNPATVERTFAGLMFVVAAGMCAKALGAFA